MAKSNTKLKKHILDKAYFIPMKVMREVVDFVEEPKNRFLKKKNRCDNNLFILQRTRLNTFDYSTYGLANWIVMFSLACHKALYAQDWDKLLYLLKKVPKWKFRMYDRMVAWENLYTRYLTLLLMYHPSSQEQGLLCEYLHMTWGCRSDQDKKAILKVLLHLPSRMPRAAYNYNNKNNAENSD